jgi:hypothetical protein
VAKQQLHSGLAPIDVLTRTELEETLHKGMDGMLRDRYRGMDFIKIPAQFGQGNGGTITLNSGGTTDPYCGPEQGDFWMLNRANVVSSSYATDAAKYILFRGGTPSDPNNALSNRYLLSGQAFTPGASTMNAPAVPASTVAAQNTTSQAYTVVVTGGTATVTTVNGVPVGGGDGTYVVPAYGSIAVTYSVAPTWTWTATQAAAQLGQNQGIAYDPGQKKVYLEPGDQLYAQVFNTTAGVTYILSGEATRVPAEMKGKIL